MQAKQNKNSFTASHWWADVQLLPGKLGSLCVMFSWQDKCRHFRSHPLPPCFPPAFIAEHDVKWHGMSLRPVGSALSSSLWLPIPHWQGTTRISKIQSSVQAVLCNYLLSVCCHHSFNQKSKLLHHTSK